MESIGIVNALLMSGALMVLAGILSSLVATRFGAPILLVFLALGMLVGEDGLGVKFSDYRLTYLVGSLALAIILFDGGLRTKLNRFRGALAPSLMLATAGVLITALLVGVLAYFVLDLGPLEALLLGSMVASTDAAAVFFLLRTGGLHLKERVNAVLEIESGTNDPFSVFLTMLFTHLVLATSVQPGPELIWELARQGFLGAILGVGGGLALATLLNRVQLPGGLHPLLVVAGAVGVYALTALMGGSGFLAVYIAGLVLGSRPVRAYPSIVSFHDAATWLAQIVMFLLLGLLVTPTKLLPNAWEALVIAVFLILVARPASVFLCLSPFGFTLNEKLFISWVGLRGGVSIFLAAIPTLAHVPHAEVYFNVAFFVVLVSLLVQGWTVTVSARRLGMALKRTIPEVARIELDIPGQFAREMVGYPITPGSFIAARGHLPSWAQPVLIVRGEKILSASEAKGFRAGDYAYVLTPPDRIRRLDRLFAPPQDDGAPDPVFGEFILNGTASIGELAVLYGLDAPAEDYRYTVEDLFAEAYGRDPQVGDRLMLGSRALLVARAVEGERVTKASLQLDELVDSLIAAARLRAPRLSRFYRGLRRALRHLGGRPGGPV